MKRTLKDLENYYSLDFSKVLEEIRKNNSKRILFQFADGLKPYALSIVDYFEEKVQAEFFIWFGDCFGACDFPLEIKKMKFDALFQFGHNDLMPNY